MTQKSIGVASSIEAHAARVRFVALLKSTAEACADDYFRLVDGWDEETSASDWEEAWTALVGGVSEGVTTVCHCLGMDEVTTQVTVDAALTFCFAHFDVINEALIEREGRATN